MWDLLLKNAHVVDPLNHVNEVCDVAIENGKIAEVGKDLQGKAEEVIDFTGLVLQPGIIDSHVHLGRMWGSPYGPKMLAMNGVTTALDMAGPLEDVLDSVPEYGVGINMAILQFASPPFTFKTNAPSKEEMETLIDKSLRDGRPWREAARRPLSAEARCFFAARQNRARKTRLRCLARGHERTRLQH